MKQKHYITRNKTRLLGDGVKEISSIMWWPLQYRRVQFKNIFKCHRTSNIILTIVVLVNLTSQNLASYPKTSKKYASLKADHEILRLAVSQRRRELTVNIRSLFSSQSTPLVAFRILCANPSSSKTILSIIIKFYVA